MCNSIDTVEEFWEWEQIEESFVRASDSSITEFVSDFSDYLGTQKKSVLPMPSGHQGLELLLKAKSDRRRVVMVPAFNCKVVQDAIESAGYRVKLYDFCPRVGEFDWERVIDAITPAVGVVIVTHYFGVPTDFRDLREYCRANDILLIEDCAQTLGGRIAGFQVGTLGDAAIFSFNYDKPISLAWGGMVVVNNAESFNKTVVEAERFQIPEKDAELDLLRDFAAAMGVRRRAIYHQNSRIIRLLKRAPFMKSGAFRKDPRISIGAVQAELGRWCLSRYSDVQKVRNRNSDSFADRVSRASWPLLKDIEPAWLKQKVHIENPRTLRRISKSLQRDGIRAGNFNWRRLIRGEGIHLCPLAKQAASCWMDVPIHQGMSETNIQRVVADIKALS